MPLETTPLTDARPTIEISTTRKVLTRIPGVSLAANMYYQVVDETTPSLTKEQKQLLVRERLHSTGISFALLGVMALITAAALHSFGLRQHSANLFLLGMSGLGVYFMVDPR